MNILKRFISTSAEEFICNNELARKAYDEISDSIKSIITNGHDIFIINNSEKNCNGVVPVKELCYKKLEEEYLWYREKPLDYLYNEMGKGGPIDVYKEFYKERDNMLRVGLEFETGNISSAHRSMNKLSIGCIYKEIDFAVLILPVKRLSYYLTDRVSNYEELEPYFRLIKMFPFIIIGFDADIYSSNVPLLPKGTDGMSKRSIRKWKNQNQLLSQHISQRDEGPTL